MGVEFVYDRSTRATLKTKANVIIRTFIFQVFSQNFIPSLLPHNLYSKNVYRIKRKLRSQAKLTIVSMQTEGTSIKGMITFQSLTSSGTENGSQGS
jgi:hypothetical protein